jgi:hypothetical protein
VRKNYRRKERKSNHKFEVAQSHRAHVGILPTRASDTALRLTGYDSPNQQVFVVPGQATFQPPQ